MRSWLVAKAKARWILSDQFFPFTGALSAPNTMYPSTTGMHAQRIQTHHSHSTSRSSTSTQRSRRMRQTPSTCFFSFWCYFLRTKYHASLHHGQGKPQRSYTPSAQCLPSCFNINAQLKKVVHINEGKTTPDLFSFRWYFLYSEIHIYSLYHGHTICKGCTHSLGFLQCLRSSRHCRHLTADLHHRCKTTWRSPEGKEGGGVGRQREAEPLAPKTNCCIAAGPHGWGPPLEVASKERRSPWWAQLHQTPNVTLQNGNTKLSILLPYQGYIVTKRQVN